MKKVIIILVGLLPYVVFAEGRLDSIGELDERIKERLEILEGNILDANNAIKQAETTLTLSQNYMNSSDKLINKFFVVLSIMIAVAAAFLISAFVFMYKNFEKFFNRKLAEITSQNIEVIESLVKKHSKEQFLLENSKILILNKSGTDIDQNFLMLLKRLSNDPEKDKIIDLKTYQYSGSLEQFDAVIFDNTNSLKTGENWDFRTNKNLKIDHGPELKRALKNLAKTICSKNVAFLFFGYNDDHFADDIPEFSHLINFVNKPATLFANLIDLLDYKRLLFN